MGDACVGLFTRVISRRPHHTGAVVAPTWWMRTRRRPAGTARNTELASAGRDRSLNPRPLGFEAPPLTIMLFLTHGTHGHTRAHTGTRAHTQARVMSPDAAKRQHFDPYFALRSTADFARDPSPRLRNSVPCPPSSLVPPSSFLPRSLPLSPVSVLPSSLPFIFHSPFSHSFMKPCARHCVARGEDRCEQGNHLRGSFLKPGLRTLRAWRPAGR